MTRNTYEALFIFDSNHYARDPGGVGAAIAKMIEELGGNVLVSRLWSDQQKLAYPINNQNKGTYWLAYYELDTDKNSELNRAIRLNDSILRHMTIKLDHRLIEPMVAHAKGEASTSDAEEPATANA